MQYRFCLDLTLMTIQQTAKNIPLSTQEQKKSNPSAGLPLLILASEVSLSICGRDS